MADEQLCGVDDVVNLPWPAFANLPESRQQSLINVASQQIINYCRRPGFTQTSELELHDGKNTAVLWLRKRPVVGITQIIINGEVLDNSDGNAWRVNLKTGKLVRGNSWLVTPGYGHPRFGIWWPVGTQNIEVDYWAGFAAVPDPVIEATAFMAHYIYNRARVTSIYQSESLGDYSYTINSTLPKTIVPDYVADLLAPYVQDDGPL